MPSKFNKRAIKKNYDEVFGYNFYLEENISKTEANAIALRDSLIDMPNRKNIIWYTNEGYQGETVHGCDCVNLFDTDTGIIVIYQKQPDGSNLFLTTCKLTQMERNYLKATNSNFVTERVLK